MTFLENTSNSPIIKTIVGSPIYTSVIIVILILVIILITFKDCIMNESMVTLMVRTGLYSLIVTTGVIFLHDNYLMKELNEQHKIAGVGELFEQNRDDDRRIRIGANDNSKESDESTS